MNNFEDGDLTQKIIGCCYEVHNCLGPGFIEKMYARALEYQLKIENIEFESEKEFSVYFKDQYLGKFRCAYL